MDRCYHRHQSARTRRDERLDDHQVNISRFHTHYTPFKKENSASVDLLDEIKRLCLDCKAISAGDDSKIDECLDRSDWLILGCLVAGFLGLARDVVVVRDELLKLQLKGGKPV